MATPRLIIVHSFLTCEVPGGVWIGHLFDWPLKYTYYYILYNLLYCRLGSTSEARLFLCRNFNYDVLNVRLQNPCEMDWKPMWKAGFTWKNEKCSDFVLLRRGKFANSASVVTKCARHLAGLYNLPSLSFHVKQKNATTNRMSPSSLYPISKVPNIDPQFSVLSFPWITHNQPECYRPLAMKDIEAVVFFLALVGVHG